MVRSCHCPARNDILTPQPTANRKPGCFSSSSNCRWLAWHPTPAGGAWPLPVSLLHDDSLRQRFWGAIWWSAIVLRLKLLWVCNTDPHVPGRPYESCIPLPERIWDSLTRCFLHLQAMPDHSRVYNRDIVNLPWMKLYLVDIGLCC